MKRDIGEERAHLAERIRVSASHKLIANQANADRFHCSLLLFNAKEDNLCPTGGKFQVEPGCPIGSRRDGDAFGMPIGLCHTTRSEIGIGPWAGRKNDNGSLPTLFGNFFVNFGTSSYLSPEDRTGLGHCLAHLLVALKDRGNSSDALL